MALRRILVVDDEPIVREVLKQTLAIMGCETREAGGEGDLASAGEDGWAPELVFLDIVMPGRTGLELLDEMKVRFPDAEIVIMTAYSSVEHVQRAIRGGARDFLSKPFTMSQVRDTLARTLDKPARGPAEASDAPDQG